MDIGPSYSMHLFSSARLEPYVIYMFPAGASVDEKSTFRLGPF